MELIVEEYRVNGALVVNGKEYRFMISVDVVEIVIAVDVGGVWNPDVIGSDSIMLCVFGSIFIINEYNKSLFKPIIERIAHKSN